MRDELFKKQRSNHMLKHTFITNIQESGQRNTQIACLIKLSERLENFSFFFTVRICTQ